MRQDSDRLQDALEAIANIERRRPRDRAVFDSDEMLRIWCLHHIFIIGEALSRVSGAFQAAHPEIPWREVVGMRNYIAHGYFDIDWEEVWNVLSRDLPPLNTTLSGLATAESPT